MYVDVEIYEGGRFVRTEKMRLKKVKELSDDIIYENEDGRAVIYLKKKGKYILISIDMA
ncbi:MAG: hypothetical protein Fur0020_13460 [Thermodesulfovibrionia bacterium]